MDGIEGRLRNSLRFRLSFWLSAAILGVALIAGGFAFLSALDEAHEFQDDVLRQIAALVDRHRLTVPDSGGWGRAADDDTESRIFVQDLAAGRSPGAALALPVGLRDGLQTVSVDGQSYRVLVKTARGGGRLALAQATSVRDEIARNGALRTLMPFLILVPILLVLVNVLVRRVFKPVGALSAAIDRRGEQELHPIAPDTLPAEIRPFVDAINRLLRRVRQSMDAQLRFVADAAHELRSPLTALSLQAERLAETPLPAVARERLGTLRAGIERGRALVDQLMALARAQAEAVRPRTPVSVRSVYRRVLEDLMPLAEAKGLDIGVTGDCDVQVLANEADLTTLVKNLVDNAIRYTPVGGRVDLSVSVSDGMAALVVDDDGPGIPQAEWRRVFDPFYRVPGSDQPGSGLGLSIVQTIAERLGATVGLGFAHARSGRGLRVTVTLARG